MGGGGNPGFAILLPPILILCEMVGVRYSLLGTGGLPKVIRGIEKGILYSLSGEAGPRLG